MQGERKRSGGHSDSRFWPIDASAVIDPRTPLAWQHRNLNYQQQQQTMQQQATYVERLSSPGHKQHQQKESPRNDGQGTVYTMEEETMVRRPSSPSTATSSTSTTSSGSQSQKNEYSNATLPMYAPTTGGVPMTPVSTWDGEPCPVHHLPAISAIIAPPPPPPQPMIMTTMSRRGTPCYPPNMIAGHPPPPPDKGMMLLVPPMTRPRRPLVVPAQNANLLEPLPVRKPKRSVSTTDDSVKDLTITTCEGHTVVLWLIIIIITIGVILAAILRFVMG